MSTNNENKNLIISIPLKTKELIDKKFGKIYSPTDLNKIYFLVFKINKENNNYQINSRNHAYMLSLKNGGELSDILVGLTAIKVISKFSNYEVNKTSNAYSLCKPYHYKDSNIHRINYYVGQCTFPKWVSRYIADGGIVKSKLDSNYKTTIEVKEDKDAIIAELLKRNAELEKELEVCYEVINLKVVQDLLYPTI